MSRIGRVTGRWLGLAGVLWAVFASGAGSATEPEPLRIGVTPVVLDEDVATMKRWRAYLAEELDRPVELVRRRSYSDMLVLLRTGQLDAAWLCGYPFIKHDEDLELLAAPLFEGLPYYRSYIIAREPHQSFQDLAGATFAFSDPDSNSGWLYPTSRKLAADARASGDFFERTFFTWTHQGVIEAVNAGLADAGAVDGYIFETIAIQKPDLVADLHIVERSPRYGFPPIVASTALAASDRQVLKQTLLDMAGNDYGRTLLDQLNLDGFAEVEGSHYDGIRSLARQVEEALGGH